MRCAACGRGEACDVSIDRPVDRDRGAAGRVAGGGALMPDSRDDGFDEQREAARQFARELARELRAARERPPAPPLILDLVNPWPDEPPRKVVMSRYVDQASRIIYGALNIIEWAP